MKRNIIIITLLFATILSGEDLKLGADLHFNYSFQDMDNHEFGISRAYFTMQRKLSDNLSYKFQTDIGSGGPTDYSLYMKSAKIDWSTGVGRFTIGLQGMNMFKVQEDTWGYRFLLKSAMDLQKFSSSADLGIGWKHKFGSLTSSVLMTDGNGYKKKEDDSHRKLSVNILHGQSKLKEGFNVGVAVSHEPKDYIVVDTVNSTSTDHTGNTLVTGVFGGWAAGPVRIGAEYVLQSINMAETSSINLFSGYVNYTLRKNLSLFGRYDRATETSDTDQLIIAGLSYQPEKNLFIAPNLLIEKSEDDAGVQESVVYRMNFRLKF